MGKFEDGIDWGMFLVGYDEQHDVQANRDDQSEDRRNSISEVVDLLESARSVDKTTVPISSVRAALVKGWYQRTREDHSTRHGVATAEQRQADLAQTNGGDVNDQIPEVEGYAGVR